MQKVVKRGTVKSLPTVGYWYKFKSERFKNTCESCNSLDGEIFIYGMNTKGNIPPLHPNCNCSLMLYNDEIRKKIKEKSPNISEYLLDQLMKKEYYKYDDVAVPFMNVGDTYYYMIDGEIFRVNLKETNGIGVLPDGRFIIGDGEANPDYKYNQIKDMIERDKIRVDTTLSSDERLRQLNEIYAKVIERIKRNYPNKSSEERQEIYKSGWLNVSPEYFMIYDVTDKLNNLMDSYITDPYWINVRDYGDSWEFAVHFRQNGDGDLKSRDGWQHSLFIYDGEIVDKDVPGNILYGFVGTFLKYTEWILLKAAGFVQTLTEKKITPDDERDQKRIRQGIRTYRGWNN